MHNGGRAASVALACSVAVGGALLYTSGSGSVQAQAYSIQVDASPRVVDEGDLVEFVAAVTDLDGFDAAGVTTTWDFGDGSRPATGKLRAITHRFADGGSPDTTYDVRVRAGRSERAVPVSVRNVAPSLRNVQRSRPALKGEPVSFEASATDPGMGDTLTYTWDFGDGATAAGHRARHTFQADGVYEVLVTVRDGDGGEDSERLSVAIGEVGAFTISGDVALPTVEVGRVRAVGISRGEGNTARCEIRLDMQPESDDYGVVLRANLVPGLGERAYTIAAATEWDGMTAGERTQPGLFFADVSLPRAHATRDINGTMVGGPFWSRGGRVDVEHFDGTYLELTYSVTLVENIPPEFNPRTLFVEGTLARRISGGGLGSIFSGMAGGSASLYRCGHDDTATFQIESVTPAPSTRNVAFLNPDIEVRFTRPVNPKTIPRAVQLDYRAPDSGTGVVRRPAAGVWEAVPGDPRAIRFVPSARLEDGVVHCVRVRSGVPGLRGQNGEILEGLSIPEYPVRHQDACVPTRTWPESREWAIETRVELQDLAAETYQASLAGGRALLVPGKPSVVRVYPFWSAKDHVHVRAQVETFPARVSVVADGVSIAAPKRLEVRRPDLFDKEDGRHARNSINFFDWQPASNRRATDVRPVIEPIDESGRAVDRWEGRSETHTVWDRTEILSFDYYYVRARGDCPNDPTGLCDWTDTIHPEWRILVRHLAVEGALFTTQNFPVIETQARAMGELMFDEPAASGPCTWFDEWKDYDCYEPGTAREELKTEYVGERLFDLGRDSYADIIVGFLPPNFDDSVTGVMQSLSSDRAQRYVLIDPSVANPTTLAHEFGHFFDLDHCPAASETACADAIAGFRLNPSGRSGFNKSAIEGNQEVPGFPPPLFPLMSPGIRELPERFITMRDYEELFAAIASAPKRASKTAMAPGPSRVFASLLNLVSRPVAAQPSAGRLLVSGTVTGGVPRLRRVRHEPGSPSARRLPTAGDLTLQLLDASGTVLETIPFITAAAADSHGVRGGPARFALEVDAPMNLHAVRVTGPSGADVRARTAGRPTVRGKATRSASGARIEWTTADPDGDEVRVSVFFRADDGPWRGVLADTPRKEVALDAAQLPSGSRVAARLVATDGFNTSSVDIDLGAGSGITAEPMTPQAGASDVPLSTEIIAWVSAPLKGSGRRSAPLDHGRFTLSREDGRAVVADVVYQPGTGLVILTPIAPLEPGTPYTATLEGVQARDGAVVSRPLTWRFVTTARR